MVYLRSVHSMHREVYVPSVHSEIGFHLLSLPPRVCHSGLGFEQSRPHHICLVLTTGWPSRFSPDRLVPACCTPPSLSGFKPMLGRDKLGAHMTT